MTAHGGAPPGWYDDCAGRQRWWDGQRWTEYTGPPPWTPVPPPPWSPAPRRRSRLLLIWLPVSVLVVIAGILLISVVSGGSGDSEWYREGYAVGHDRAVSLARMGGTADSACDLALMDRIAFDDNARSTRVQDLRRGCVKGVEDALAERRGRP